MVIWPKKVHVDDADWHRVCALLLVLALDPRRPASHQRHSLDRKYFDSADDFLVRPDIWVDRKLVPAPYYTYCLRFSVSLSAHGSIEVDDVAQIETFKEAVNAALHGKLTVAERKRWEANTEFLKCCAANDSKAELFAAAGREEGQRADRYYRLARESIEAPRRLSGYVAASLSSHEEVLESLVCLGSSLLKAA